MRPGQPLVMMTHAAPPDGAVRWPADRNDRLTWQSALRDPDVRESWRRAYEGELPTRAELAVVSLWSALRENAGEPLLLAA